MSGGNSRRRVIALTLIAVAVALTSLTLEQLPTCEDIQEIVEGIDLLCYLDD